MALYFHNNYAETVSLAVGLSDSGCSPSFRKHGWFKIHHGHTLEVYSGDLSAIIPFICYWYAMAADGTVWAGPYNTLVSTGSFDQCFYDDTGMTENKGFREFTPGSKSYKSHTINLHK
jgi:Protein of unknown function (DUF1036)